MFQGTPFWKVFFHQNYHRIKLLYFIVQLFLVIQRCPSACICPPTDLIFTKTLRSQSALLITPSRKYSRQISRFASHPSKPKSRIQNIILFKTYIKYYLYRTTGPISTKSGTKRVTKLKRFKSVKMKGHGIYHGDKKFLDIC